MQSVLRVEVQADPYLNQYTPDSGTCQTAFETILKKSDMIAILQVMGMDYEHKFQRLLEERKDWSVRKLAAHAKVPAATAHRLTKEPTDAVLTVWRMASALGVSVEWLLDDDRGWPPEGPLVPSDMQNPAVIGQILRVIGEVLVKASRTPGGLK